MRGAALAVTLLGLAACGGGSDEPPTFQGAQVTVGFGDTAERLEVWTSNRAFYEEARARVGLRVGLFPTFDLRDGSSCDARFSWHVDPATPAFADAAMELCDGLPSAVEAEKAYWLGTVKRFCPWSAWIVAVREPVASPGRCE